MFLNAVSAFMAKTTQIMFSIFERRRNEKYINEMDKKHFHATLSFQITVMLSEFAILKRNQ